MIYKTSLVFLIFLIEWAENHLSEENVQKLVDCHNEIRSHVAKNGINGLGTAANMRKLTWNTSFEKQMLLESPETEFEKFQKILFHHSLENLSDKNLIAQFCLSKFRTFSKNLASQTRDRENHQFFNANLSEFGCAIKRWSNNATENSALLCYYDAPLTEALKNSYISGEPCTKCEEGDFMRCDDNLCARNLGDAGTKTRKSGNQGYYLVGARKMSRKIQKNLVACHNKLRGFVAKNGFGGDGKKVADMRKLTWSKTLAEEVFLHLSKSPKNYQSSIIFHEPKNIESSETLVENWCNLAQISVKNLELAEVYDFDLNQLIFPNSTKFGCAETRSENSMIICRYDLSPLTKLEFSTGEPCSKCPEDFGKCENGLCAKLELLEVAEKNTSNIEMLEDSDISELVNCHNEIRSHVANHGFAMDSGNTAMDMRKMYWSQKMVPIATSQVKYLRENLADEDRWRGITLFHNPENISNSQIIKNWCEDRKKFLENLWNFRYNDPKIDEYLQIIHAKSAKFGCAINRWKNENTIIVCAYKYHPDMENMHSVYQRGIPCGNCGEGWKCGEEQKLCEKVKILEVETTTTSDYDIFSDKEREFGIDFNENEVQTTTSDYDIFDDLETTTELFETEEDIEDPVLKNNVFMSSSEEEQDLGLERNVFVIQEEEEEESSTVTHSPDLPGQTQAPSITVVTPGPVNPPQAKPQIPQSPGNIHINIYNNRVPEPQQVSWPHLYPQTGPHIGHPSQTSGSHQTPIIYHPNYAHDFGSTQNHQMIWVHPVFKNGTRSPHPIQMPAPALIGPSGSQGYPGTHGQPSGSNGYPGTQGQPSGTQNAPPGSHTYPSTQIVPALKLAENNNPGNPGSNFFHPHNNNHQMMWVHPVFKNGTRSPHPILMPASSLVKSHGYPAIQNGPQGSQGYSATQNLSPGDHGPPATQNTPPGSHGHPHTHNMHLYRAFGNVLSDAQNIALGTHGYPASQNVPRGSQGHSATQNSPPGNHGYPASQNVPRGSHGYSATQNNPPGTHGYPASQNVPSGGHGYPNTHGAQNYQQGSQIREIKVKPQFWTDF